MIQFIPISDVHNEFQVLDNSVFYKPDTINTVLVIAGDFFVSKKWNQLQEIIAPLSEMFHAIVYVLGNHDHWGGSFANNVALFKQNLAMFPNVHVLEKESVVFGNVAFIGATMWTDFSKHNPHVMWDAQANMNDYKKIRNGPVSDPYKKRLFPTDVYLDHINAKHFLQEEIQNHKLFGNKVVVITHQAPSSLSRMSTIASYDPLNGCYYSDMEAFVEYNQPDFWIHGHIHESKNYKIGNTRVICNPRGYSPFDLNEEFDPNKLIIID